MSCPLFSPKYWQNQVSVFKPNPGLKHGLSHDAHVMWPNVSYLLVTYGPSIHESQHAKRNQQFTSTVSGAWEMILPLQYMRRYRILVLGWYEPPEENTRSPCWGSIEWKICRHWCRENVKFIAIANITCQSHPPIRCCTWWGILAREAVRKCRVSITNSLTYWEIIWSLEAKRRTGILCVGTVSSPY